ncbi:hypothetical protein CPC08DRAFT_770226 [Agrocybe pediades]|nr:hypothetical protein CPC08DRAFT_770226 [Agrocybe pediades]
MTNSPTIRKYQGSLPATSTEEDIHSYDYSEFAGLFTTHPLETPESQKPCEPSDMSSIETIKPHKKHESVATISSETIKLLTPTLSPFLPDFPERPESPIVFASPKHSDMSSDLEEDDLSEIQIIISRPEEHILPLTPEEPTISRFSFSELPLPTPPNIFVRILQTICGWIGL